MPTKGTALSIVERLFECCNLRNAAAYTYGSAAWSDDHGRDLDLVLVSPDLSGAPRLCSFTLPLPANAYLVPHHVFLEDVENLAAGGFYAHKFLFGFREIKSIGAFEDAAALFWRRAIAPILEATRSPEQLIYQVQRYALASRPTLARSLAKFLVDDDRSARLLDFVSALVKETAIDRVPAHWRQQPRHAPAAFHLFWSEYAKHKAHGDLLAVTVRQKMQSSMSYLSSPAVEHFVDRETDDIS